jgi:dolichyl-phosphate beta-glucosyltransferase
MKKIYLSLVVPVFNEQDRIDNVVKIYHFLKAQSYSNELIIINDGSIDQTLVKLKKLQKKFNFKLISYSLNQGKGYAVKAGMLQAMGELRLFLDIDLSTPLTEIPKFIDQAQKGSEVIIGSRKTKGSRVLKHQSLLRENMGKTFTLLSRLILNTWVSDFTCGFKMFNKTATQKIFKKQTINRWGFDAEILFLANKYNYKIEEIPVSWKDNSMTKVRFPKDIFSSLYELLIIRANNFLGKYS